MKKGYFNPATAIVLFYVGALILSIFAEFVDFEEINLNPWDYARITDVEYKAVINDDYGSNGKAEITEKLTFDIHAFSKGNLFWELWRDLCEDTVDGVKVHYKVKSVKEILPNGTYREYKPASDIYWYDYEYRNGPYKYYHSPGPYNPDYDKYECVFFYVNGLYREKVQFEIEYEMYNAALRYLDCSELYLSMYSGSSIKHLKSFKAEILIPDDKMPAFGNYEVHTFGTANDTFNFTESDFKNDGYHTFSIDLDESELKFKPYNQYIELTLLAYGPDRHKFTQNASHNRYYNDVALDELLEEQKQYDNAPIVAKNIKSKILIISIILSVIVVASGFAYAAKIRRPHTFYKPNMNVQYFREIPSDLDPYFAATLVFSKEGKEKELKDVYAALMLSLVRKKYISLEKKNSALDWTPKNTMFKILAREEEISKDSASTMSSSSFSSFDNTHINSLEKDFGVSTMDIIDEIQRNASKNAAYSDRYITLEALTPSEEEYLNLLYRYNRGGELSVEEFNKSIKIDFSHTDSFVKKLKRAVTNIGVLHGYFQKSDYDSEKKKILNKAKRSRNWGIIFIVLVNFLSHFSRLDYAFGAFTILGIAHLIKWRKLAKIAGQSVLLTQYGEDEYVKWKGLYDFLNSQTLMHEKEVIELPLWEKYLVYATAFGISNKVIKALAIRAPEMDLVSSPMFNNTYYRSTHFRSSGRSFSSGVRSASRSYSSFSSGGGYYGGGGRGGGGGGGGH